MGEGKKDRSEKRAKSSYGIDKSSSDTELANQDKHRTRTPRGRREQWAFIDGLTVDKLARFRRRHVDHQKDSLGLNTEDDMKDLITEYRYAFRSTDDIYKAAKENIWAPTKKEVVLEPPSPAKVPVVEPKVQDEPKVEYLLPAIETKSDTAKSESADPSPRRSISSFSILDDDRDVDEKDDIVTSTAVDQPFEESSIVNKPDSSMERRGNRHGEFYGATEYSSFIAYPGFHRPQLARRGTSLKMEGEIETLTEKCEKFIRWLNVTRPELLRVPTHLKLEGDFETSTESHEQYVSFLGVKPSESFRHHDHLKLEGESRFIPEYTDVFKEFDIADARQKSKIPVSHLRPGGNFFDPTEAVDNFVSPRSRQVQLMAELAREVEVEEEKKKHEMKSDIEKKREEDMKVLMAKLEDLKGPAPEIPEYKDSYKDFPRERPKIYKRDCNIGKADGTKVLPTPLHTRFPRIDQDPEYKSIYLDLPKDRPAYRSPSNMRSPGLSSGRASVAMGSKSGSREYLGPGFDGRPHGRIPRPDPFRVPSNVKLEGDYDFPQEQPTVYHSRRVENYVQNSEERWQRRTSERSISASRKENYWASQDNGEQFGRVNAADDQDAFQVLQMRVHEDSVVGKPPPASRRPSRAPRPTHLDFADRSMLQNRSPSPSYRLHVCNVDDEPWGFGRSSRNRSPSVHKSSEKLRDASQKPPLPDLPIRSFSPSPANKERRSSGGTTTSEQSFVVLDNAAARTTTGSNNNTQKPKEPRSRRRHHEDLDQNSNSEYSSGNLLTGMSRARPRNHTPPKWMPPWYDSSDTI